MSSVTQTIPSYTGGLSQQPDELKVPGQVKTAKNVLPDVTEGLMKRPGSQLIGSLMDESDANKALNSDHVGKWFHYYRDETEQYIGQIARDGDVNMWGSDGSTKTVHLAAKPWVAATAYVVGDKVKNNSNVYKCSTAGTSAGSGGPTAGSGTAIADNTAKWDFVAAASGLETSITNYLVNTSDEDLQTLTLNDYTYINNRTKTVTMAGTTEPVRPPEAYIQLKKVAYASQYALNIFDSTATTDVTTATRISAEQWNGGYDSMLPNVGTKIFSITGRPNVQVFDLRQDGIGQGSNSAIYNGTDGWYRIDDGTTECSVECDLGSNRHLETVERIAEGLRNHPKYDQLKFTIGTTSQKDNINDTIEYGQEFLCAFKTGGAQSTLATLERATTEWGLAQDSWTAKLGYTNLGGITGVDGGTNNREDLYFRLTVTGQAVPHQRDETPQYFGRYQTVVDLLHGGQGWTEGEMINVGFKGCSYKITIDETSTSRVQANLGLIRPTPTSFDAKTVVTAESIIGALRTNILGSSNGGSNALYQWKDDEGNGYHCKQIGSGLYISRPTSEGSFNANTPVDELLNVVTDSIKDIADLPNQCKHGYVVKVANSDSEEDDYYVKFFGHNDRDGEGVWEECAKPGTEIEYQKTSLPIQLVRQADGSFVLDHIDWDQAQVGDTAVDGTNPRASFVGNTINKMLFFRNRLVLLSDENVVMSRPGDFFNFWGKSAIQLATSDPIDISCSSEFPAIVYDGIQVNSGLVLFTKNQQFMLTTDSDVLSPLTAKINFISSYNFNYKTNPFSLGTTIGFLDNAGKNSRFMEMARVLREGEPDVIEQSKIVSKLLNKDLDLVSNSRENGLAFFSEKNTTTLYGFKYFNASDKRIQQSWFTWEFKNKIVHHAVLDDDLYLVTANSRVLTNQIVGRSGNNFTLTNHGLAVGDSLVFRNPAAPNLLSNSASVGIGDEGTTFYVSTIPDSNSFTVSDSQNTNVNTLSGGNTQMYINYTSNKNVLQKLPLKIHTDSQTITDDKDTVDTSDDVIYKIHLDNMTTVASTSLADYDSTNDRTTFTVPTGFNLNSDLSAYVVPTGTDDTLRGLCQNITLYDENTATPKVSLPGNWKTYNIANAVTVTDGATADANTITITYANHPFKVGDVLQLNFPNTNNLADTVFSVASSHYTVATVPDSNTFTVANNGGNTQALDTDVSIESIQTPTNNIILGQKYDYEVKLPTIYYTTQSGDNYRSDRRGSLVLHRLKLNFGHSGLYETLIERTGKPDYSEIWEPSLADDYLANQVVFEEEITRTIPIYDRNSNTSITIKSSHPSPATLYSLTWEGDYSKRFYTSV